MSNKQRLSIEVISKDDALSMIKNNAESSGPGLIMTEKGRDNLTNQIHQDTFDAASIINKNENFDIVEPKAAPVIQPQQDNKSSLKSKLKKSGSDLKNKGKIKTPTPKLK
ncbi:hypothetical protein ACTOJ1_001523 [Shigella flexneri]